MLVISVKWMFLINFTKNLNRQKPVSLMEAMKYEF